jgi:hypothetical protein
MPEAHLISGAERGIDHWSLDGGAGLIKARDRHGNLVLAIVVGPLFASRLVAAFSSGAVKASELG